MTVTIDPANFQGPVVVTAGYFALWYGLLLGLQRSTKYRLVAEYAARGEEFDRYFGQDGRMLAVDRAVINTHEQMVPFLLSMWLYALFVSPGWATTLGAVYVALRAAYPFLLGRNLSRVNPRRVFLATGPCYVIVFFMIGSTVHAVF